MEIKDLLKNLDKNLVTEETANAIAEAFDKAVSEKTESRVALAVEKALFEQDEDHAQKLKHILEKADDDHCEKLKTVVKAISESHTKKLANIVEFYKKSIDQKAKTFSEKVITDLDKFLSLYLEKKIPYTQIKEAVENTSAKAKLEEIRKLVSFDPEMVQESVKGVIKEGKQKLDTVSTQLNEANEEIARLQREIGKIKSTVILEGKTKGMPSSKKEFVFKLLEDKDVQYIQENFNYVVEMFENGEKEEAQKLAVEASEKAISRDAKVPVQTISESTVIGKPKGLVDGYLSELVRITK